MAGLEVTDGAFQAAHFVALRRESVPVVRMGKVASFRTSYSGTMNVGNPPQEFRVVFDTGSGHVVLPSIDCSTPTCEVHSQYNHSSSESALAMNLDGTLVGPKDAFDKITIGFGTGNVVGRFVRDEVCVGGDASLCVAVNMVVATEMSEKPFKTANFDGILGLGLQSLAIKSTFSFVQSVMQGKGMQFSRFAVFLTDSEDGEGSEIAFGGLNPLRVGAPLSWTQVVNPELGHWLVHIVAVWVNGEKLDMCDDGTCRGIVDTGTSHLGIPTPHESVLATQLTTPSGDLLDCRLARAPELRLEMSGFNLTLNANDYMRRLPLRQDVEVGSTSGVVMAGASTANGTTISATGDSNVNRASSIPADSTEISRDCRPRLVPVRLPPPMGPKLFILGEPMLHRYYTIFDFEALQIGFSRMNDRNLITNHDEKGSLPKDVDILLMQGTSRISQTDKDSTDEVIMFQIAVQLSRSASVSTSDC